jgi:D-xylose transport system substrate-binding protein
MGSATLLLEVFLGRFFRIKVVLCFRSKQTRKVSETELQFNPFGWRFIMMKFKLGAIGLLSLSLVSAYVATNATAQSGMIVGVSWSNFQEERWKTDEAAIKGALEKGGASYISTDAQSSAEKQVNDVNQLITKGAKAIILLAQDKDAIGPAMEAAKAAKIPVIAYDRLVEDPYAYYLTFDNVEVGRIMAREVLKVKSKGQFVFIKGDPGDANAEFVYGGQREILEPNIKSEEHGTNLDETQQQS